MGFHSTALHLTLSVHVFPEFLSWLQSPCLHCLVDASVLIYRESVTSARLVSKLPGSLRRFIPCILNCWCVAEKEPGEYLATAVCLLKLLPVARVGLHTSP